MNACEIVAYTLDGAALCTNCAPVSIPARFHGCGKPGVLFDPGWHNCGETGPDGSPCHIEASEGEDPCPVFGDGAEGIIGWTCDGCGACFGPDLEWSEPDCDPKQWRWGTCEACNHQRPFGRDDSGARMAALGHALLCGGCGRGAVHF